MSGNNSSVDRIVLEALELPTALRAFLAEKLIESLEMAEIPTLSERWREEIQRRCTEIDKGTVVLRNMDEVFARPLSSLE